MQQTQQWQQKQQQQAAQIAQEKAQTTIAQASHELQTAVSHAQHTTEQQNVQTQQLWQQVQAELPRMVSAAIYQAQQTQPSSSSSAPHAAQPVYYMAGPSQDIPDAHDIVDEPEEADGKKPRLPFYDGTHDPELWIKQVDVAFQAYRTPHSQQAAWMILALRGTAMHYWFVECQPQFVSTPPTAMDICTVLRKRFRPYTHNYEVYLKLQRLRMQPSHAEEYNRQFLALQAQCPTMTPQELFHAYIRGLTADYRELVLLQNCTTVTDAIDVVRRKSIARQHQNDDDPRMANARQRRPDQGRDTRTGYDFRKKDQRRPWGRKPQQLQQQQPKITRTTRST